ncbi:MAG: RNA-guided endonuclease IscB, partial [Bulleidia sp.]|nr:RNA-guided endonuclease IscB [Bulleidia sp.]
MYVYVINRHGEPLMPCKPQKARVLLQNGKATVVKRNPFTIKLIYGSSGYKQPVTLGMDAGSKHVGIAATTEKNVLYAEELSPRNDVVNLLSNRRQNRRTRRNWKTRYRQARFENRVHSKPKGWIAPSVEVKIQEHVSAITRITKILPITKIRVETAEFDMQRLK